MCRRSDWRLPGRPESVPHGRRVVRQQFRDWGLGRDDPAWVAAEDVALIVTELLGNAVHVCAGPIEVSLDAHRTHVVAAVRDDSPAAASEQPLTVRALRGRGLRIVSELSVDWGQTSYHDGAKQVWAKVEVPAGSALGDHCEL